MRPRFADVMDASLVSANEEDAIGELVVPSIHSGTCLRGEEL